MKTIDKYISKGKTIKVKMNKNEIEKFDYNGIYVFYDGDEVVYIGSAYKQTVAERLRQYLNNSSGTQRVRKKIRGQGKKITDFEVLVIPYIDLEYLLIKEENPRYNKNGRQTISL